ncbi:hypothetical protein F4810DRAFT_679446 [Camillea tinctor]|nr:hypothetical protein F4810DRAFT_679446 [Camillea tinctor]
MWLDLHQEQGGLTTTAPAPTRGVFVLLLLLFCYSSLPIEFFFSSFRETHPENCCSQSRSAFRRGGFLNTIQFTTLTIN